MIKSMRLAAIGFTLVLLVGCDSYRPTTAPVPVGQPVEVRFDPPGDVRVLALGDTSRLAGVRYLRGNVVAVHGDTIAILVERVQGATRLRLPEGTTALVPPAPGTRVGVPHFSILKSARALVLAGAGLFFVVMVIATAGDTS